MTNVHVPQTEPQSVFWPPERGVRVLVVNDYADNVESMAMLLRLYGHEIGRHSAALLPCARHGPIHRKSSCSIFLCRG